MDVHVITVSATLAVLFTLAAVGLVVDPVAVVAARWISRIRRRRFRAKRAGAASTSAVAKGPKRRRNDEQHRS